MASIDDSYMDVITDLIASLAFTRGAPNEAI